MVDLRAPKPSLDALECCCEVSVVIEKDEHGYYAFSPELEGCQSQGVTFEEAVANVREAIGLYLETLTPDEIRERTSREIVTTSLEVAVG
jgi:predicted RNase H-like HicB family nuclease